MSTGIGEKSFELSKHFSKGPSCNPSASVAGNQKLCTVP